MNGAPSGPLTLPVMVAAEASEARKRIENAVVRSFGAARMRTSGRFKRSIAQVETGGLEGRLLGAVKGSGK